VPFVEERSRNITANKASTARDEDRIRQGLSLQLFFVVTLVQLGRTTGYCFSVSSLCPAELAVPIIRACFIAASSAWPCAFERLTIIFVPQGGRAVDSHGLGIGSFR
jgi:hypothetical protein